MNNNTTTTSNIKQTIFPSQYSLHNADNYLDSFHSSSSTSSSSSSANIEILNKYKILVLEYLQFILENMNCKSDEIYKYIVLRGLTTITHVYQLTLLHTRNLNLSYFHSQKAFYYYVEFIGQITGEQNTFLQLTSKDAIMFVYKKTIFEIHSDFRKSPSNFQDESIQYEIFHLLDVYCQIMKTIVSQFITQEDFIKIRINKTYIQELKKIEKTSEMMNTAKINSNQLQKIKLVIDSLGDIKDNYHETIQIFITKFLKSKVALELNQDIFKEKISKYILANNIRSETDIFMNYLIPN
uniref:Uncharacterized protein n=1 Tax=viral metagenome TaxID=1070528 RepID=A0A6C0HAE8_9ZZZZ